MRIAILATGLIVVSACSSCGNSARPRRGPLAAAADSVAAAFSVQCNGPDACFGYRGGELGFFETTQSGDVKFVARRSRMTHSAADSLAVHLRDSLDHQYGAGTACASSTGKREERQWLHDGRQVVVVMEMGGTSDGAEVTLIQRSTPKQCGVLEEPERFK